MDKKGFGTLALTCSLGILFLAVTNVIKFGQLSPLHYGHTISIRPPAHADFTRFNWGYLRPLFAYFMLFIPLLIWQQNWHQKVWKKPLPGTYYAVAWSIFAVATLLILPDFLGPSLKGLKQIWWDLRNINMAGNASTSYAVLRFSEDGAYLFRGEIKRALLQSCPFILLGLLPFFAQTLRREIPLARFAWVWAGALMFPLFYGILGWHGGFGFNMRYLMPALPFFSIAAALPVAIALQTWRIKPLARTLCLVCPLAAVTMLQFWLAGQPTATKALWLQHIPHWLVILAPIVFYAAIRTPLWRKPALVLVTVVGVWGGISAAVIHYPAHNVQRRVASDYTAKIADTIAEDALYIGQDWRVGLMPEYGKRVRVLNPHLMKDDELNDLLFTHLQWNIALYLGPGMLYEQEFEAKLRGWGLELIDRGHYVKEIVKAP